MSNLKKRNGEKPDNNTSLFYLKMSQDACMRGKQTQKWNSLMEQFKGGKIWELCFEGRTSLTRFCITLCYRGFTTEDIKITPNTDRCV